MARLLVIDDEEIVRMPLCLMLRNAGMEVEEAANGREGVDLYRRKPADLVIVDLLMPVKDGLEVIRDLVQENPDVKIIGMAAYGEDLLAQAVELGARRTFQKPFHLKDMCEAVEGLLKE